MTTAGSIVNFFQTAPLSEARLVLDICKTQLKAREPQAAIKGKKQRGRPRKQYSAGANLGEAIVASTILGEKAAG